LDHQWSGKSTHTPGLVHLDMLGNAILYKLHNTYS